MCCVVVTCSACVDVCTIPGSGVREGLHEPLPQHWRVPAVDKVKQNYRTEPITLNNVVGIDSLCSVQNKDTCRLDSIRCMCTTCKCTWGSTALDRHLSVSWRNTHKHTHTHESKCTVCSCGNSLGIPACWEHNALQFPPCGVHTSLPAECRHTEDGIALEKALACPMITSVHSLLLVTGIPTHYV